MLFWGLVLVNEDAYKMMDEMGKCGIGPNSRLYDIVISHQLTEARRIKEAYSVFQREAVVSHLTQPTLSTYEIFRMLCNQDLVDMAMRILELMKSKGVLPRMHILF